MKRRPIFLLVTIFAAAFLMWGIRSPIALHDAPASFQDGTADLEAAFQKAKAHHFSNTPSVSGVSLGPEPFQADGNREASRQFIPEVLSLKQDQFLPRSLFDKYDTNAIAESLVERVYRMAPASVVSDGVGSSVNMWAETELHIWAHSKNFPSFISRGILNLFQTGTTRGDYDLYGRNWAEERMLKVRLSSPLYDEGYRDDGEGKINGLRPKYGRVVFPKISSNHPLWTYGDFYFILKDHLKLRALWTRGDSLNKLDSEWDKFNLERGTFWSHLPRPVGDSAFEFQVFGDVHVEDIAAVGVVLPPLVQVPQYAVFTRTTPKKFRSMLVDAGFKVVGLQCFAVNANRDCLYKSVVISEGKPGILADWISRLRSSK